MAEAKKPSLSEYWNMLNQHDWFYDYSDDHRAWRQGADASRRLQELTKQGPEYQSLYKDFSAHFFSGPAFGTSRAPLPAKPSP